MTSDPLRHPNSKRVVSDFRFQIPHLKSWVLNPRSAPATVCMMVLLVSGTARSDDWGNLSGTFVFDGNAPTPTPLVVSKDAEVCGIHKLVDESVVVNSENKGLANVIVYFSPERGAAPPKVHESYTASAAGEVKLDNKSCRFEPHVTLLRTSQTLVVGNSDTVGHNTKIDVISNGAFNPIVPAGGSLKQKFTRAERLPTRVSCNIHPWMTGWLVIKDDPYFAVSDENGHFEIKNLPIGKWTFQVWHEGGGGTYIKEVTRGGKSEKWKKGKVEFEIKAGDNDLGTLTVPASLLGK